MGPAKRRRLYRKTDSEGETDIEGQDRLFEDAGVQRKLLHRLAVVIDRRPDLSESCRKMLITALGGSLLAPANERRGVQQLAVRLVSQIFEGIVGELEVIASSADAEANATESAADTLRAAVDESEAALARATEVVAARSQELDEASVKSIETEKVLIERQNEQRKADPGLVEVALYRDRLELAVNSSLRALQSGDCEAGEAGKILKGFLPLVKSLDLEDSLLKALPTTCAKKPSERSNFDQLVMQQLERVLTEKVQSMSQEIKKREQACQELSDRVNDARQTRIAVQEVQKAASARLVEARKLQSNANDAVEAAHKAISDSQPVRSAASYTAKMKHTSLKDFKEKCLNPFVALRDKHSEA
mmetsp:Transcript_126037/g.245857  ORF Transcript_126037/g.245857 Transcript_126037/m.245857 type:complete len:361 (-) Transcript_126037:88-1170(-)